MQSSAYEKLEKKKRELKNKIKNFLKKEKIPFIENSEMIEIKGEIFYANIKPYAELSIRISENKFITVEEREDKIILSYFIASLNPSQKPYSNEIELEKTYLDYIMPGIYFMKNKLVFLF